MLLLAVCVQSPSGVTHQSQGGEEAVEEKTEFTVKLVKYSDDSKIKLIKEVKTLVEGMNLVQVCVYTPLTE